MLRFFSRFFIVRSLFSVYLGVMRNKRRNTYVVNHPLNIDLSSKESFSNSLTQSNTTNYDLSSSAPESTIQPAHGSLKSVQSLDDNTSTLPHQLKRSQYSIDQSTESSTTDLVTNPWIPHNWNCRSTLCAHYDKLKKIFNNICAIVNMPSHKIWKFHTQKTESSRKNEEKKYIKIMHLSTNFRCHAIYKLYGIEYCFIESYRGSTELANKFMSQNCIMRGALCMHKTILKLKRVAKWFEIFLTTNKKR